MKTVIKKIILKGEKKVAVDYSQTIVLPGGIVIPKDSKDTFRIGAHADLKRCMDKMTPHILFSLGLIEPQVFDPTWFADFKFSDDPFHRNIEVTGVEISGKDQDTIQIIGFIANEQGQECEIKSAKISLLDKNPENEGEAKKYVLLDIIRDNLKDLLSEVDQLIELKKYEGSTQGKLHFDRPQ